MKRAWALAAAATAAFAVPAHTAHTVEAPVTFSGNVVSATTRQPLRRARVFLQHAGNSGSGYFDTTDEHGRFSISNAAPGKYTVLVQRDGYLPQSSARWGGYRMPAVFTLGSSQPHSDFTFEMQPWSVIAGHVQFEDGEPAIFVNARVYHEYWYRNRHGYTVAGSALTDDRGAYRVPGLAPGRYYVAAVYERAAPGKDVAEQHHYLANDGTRRELRYTMTFHSQTQKLVEALPVDVQPAQELDDIDVLLAPVPVVHIRGVVTNGHTGQTILNASLDLRRADADDLPSLALAAQVRFDRDGNFDIADVPPGPYVLVVNAADNDSLLAARTFLNVSENGVNDLHITAAPDIRWTGHIDVDPPQASSLAGLQVSFEPRRDGAAPRRATVARDGSFSLSVVPEEMYDLFVLNLPNGAYIESATASSVDFLRSGVRLEAGANPPSLTIKIRGNGPSVAGTVSTSGRTAASGANVALVPDPPVGRVQRYVTASTDRWGRYTIEGVAPGHYIALAWYDEAPCDIYDPVDVPRCRAAGREVDATDGGRAYVDLTVP